MIISKHNNRIFDYVTVVGVSYFFDMIKHEQTKIVVAYLFCKGKRLQELTTASFGDSDVVVTVDADNLSVSEFESQLFFLEGNL